MKVKELYKLPIYDCGFSFITAEECPKLIADSYNYEEKEILATLGECEVEGITVGDPEEMIIRVITKEQYNKSDEPQKEKPRSVGAELVRRMIEAYQNSL